MNYRSKEIKDNRSWKNEGKKLGELQDKTQYFKDPFFRKLQKTIVERKIF